MIRKNLFILVWFFPFALFAQSSLTFAVVGDIMNHELQIQTAYNKQIDAWDYKFSFEFVKPYLENADIAMGNLETTLPGDRTQFSGYPLFGAPDELLEAIKWAGFDILTLANNHCVDKGLDALIRTRNMLEKNEIIPLGTFYNDIDQEKNAVVIYQKNGFKLALLNFTYGTNGIPVPSPAKVNEIDLNLLKKQIRKARELNPDVIIVLLHYGTEYQTQPDIYQHYVVHIALKEGADIILGGHPHVLQPFEVVQIQDKYGQNKNRLIVWSLGNFVSNQLRVNTDGGMIFQFQLTKQNNHIFIENIDYLPVYVDFREKHYILPIHEYIYLSSIIEKNKTNYGSLTWNNKKYFIYFKNENVNHKQKMVQFFINSLEILKVLPKKIEIR